MASIVLILLDGGWMDGCFGVCLCVDRIKKTTKSKVIAIFYLFLFYSLTNMEVYLGWKGGGREGVFDTV